MFSGGRRRLRTSLKETMPYDKQFYYPHLLTRNRTGDYKMALSHKDWELPNSRI